jgi:hypothetical protein
MTFETELERWKDVDVLMLRVSSGIGKPGIEVPNTPLSSESNGRGEWGIPGAGTFCLEEWPWAACSSSPREKLPIGNRWLVSTTGGAARDGTVKSEWGFSALFFVDVEMFEVVVAVAVIDGLRASTPPAELGAAEDAAYPAFDGLFDVEATAEDRGPEMLFILDRNEVTRL